MIANLIAPGRHLVISIDDYDPGNTLLAQEFLRLGLQATFFVELLKEAGAQDQIAEIARMGMTMGSHTMHHPQDLKALTMEQIRSEVVVSRRMVQDLSGQPCRSFCYPRGRYNDDIVGLVRQAGYDDARTTEVLRTDMPEDPFRMGTSIHVYQRAEYDGVPWAQVAMKLWGKVMTEGGVFHIWGHAKEMNRDHLTGQFLEFLATITSGTKNAPPVWI